MSAGTEKLLELLLWVNDGEPTPGLLQFLSSRMVDAEQQQGQVQAQAMGETAEIRRRDITSVLLRVLPLCGCDMARPVIQLLQHLAAQSPTSVAVLGASPLWDCYYKVRHMPASPSEQLFHLLCEVSAQSLGYDQTSSLLANLFFTRDARELSEHLLLCKRVLASASPSPAQGGESNESVSHFFSFTGKDVSGLVCAARPWPEKGFTITTRVYPHTLVNEPRLFAFGSVSTTYVECFMKNRVIGVITRRGDQVHQVEIPCPPLLPKVWTKLTVAFTYRRVYSSFIAVYANEVEVGQANLKYPVVKGGDKATLRLLALAPRRHQFCGLLSRIVVFRESLKDVAPSPEVDCPRGPTGGDRPAAVWHYFTPTKCTRRQLIDTSYAGESRSFQNADRTQEVSCHTLHSPLNALKQAGGAALFVFLLKRLSASFHSICNAAQATHSPEGDAAMTQAVRRRRRLEEASAVAETLIRDCIVTTIEIVCDLYTREIAQDGRVGMGKGFALVSLVLRSLPRELLPMHVVRVFTGLIQPASGHAPHPSLSEHVLCHVLFGTAGTAIWLRAPFESQRTVLERVSECISRKLYLQFPSQRAFCAWFEQRVASVPSIVEGILPLYYASEERGAAEALPVSPAELACLRVHLISILNSLLTFGEGMLAQHTEALLFAIEKASAKGCDSSEKRVADLLELLLGMMLRGGGGAQLYAAMERRSNRFVPMLATYWGHPNNTIKALSIKIYTAMQGRVTTIFHATSPAYYLPVVEIIESCGMETDIQVYCALKEAAVKVASPKCGGGGTPSPDDTEWQRVENASVLPAMLRAAVSETNPAEVRKSLAADLISGLLNDPAAAELFLEALPLYAVFGLVKGRLGDATVLDLLAALLRPALPKKNGAGLLRDAWCCVRRFYTQGGGVPPSDATAASAAATTAAISIAAALSLSPHLHSDPLPQTQQEGEGGDEAEADEAETEDPTASTASPGAAGGDPRSPEPQGGGGGVGAGVPLHPHAFILRLFAALLPDLGELMRSTAAAEVGLLRAALSSFGEVVFITHKVVRSGVMVPRDGEAVPTVPSHSSLDAVPSATACIDACLSVFKIAHSRKLCLMDSANFVAKGDQPSSCDEDCHAEAGSTSPSSSGRERKKLKPRKLRRGVVQSEAAPSDPSGEISTSTVWRPPPVEAVGVETEGDDGAEGGSACSSEGGGGGGCDDEEEEGSLDSVEREVSTMHTPPSLIDSHFAFSAGRPHRWGGAGGNGGRPGVTIGGAGFHSFAALPADPLQAAAAAAAAASTSPAPTPQGREPHPQAGSPLVYRLLYSLALHEFRALLRRHYAADEGGLSPDAPHPLPPTSPEGGGGGGGVGVPGAPRSAVSESLSAKRQYLRVLAGRLQGAATGSFHTELAGYLSAKVVELHGRLDQDAAKGADLADTLINLLGALLCDGRMDTPCPPVGPSVKAPAIIPLLHLASVTHRGASAPEPPSAGDGSGSASLKQSVSRLMEHAFLQHPDAVSHIQDVSGARWLTLDVSKWCTALRSYIARGSDGFAHNPLLRYKLGESAGRRVGRLRRRADLLSERRREALDSFFQELALLRGRGAAAERGGGGGGGGGSGALSPPSGRGRHFASPAAARRLEVSRRHAKILHSEWQEMESLVLDSLVLQWWSSPLSSLSVPLLHAQPHTTRKAKENVYWRIDTTGYRMRLVRYKPVGMHAAGGDYRRHRAEEEEPDLADAAAAPPSEAGQQMLRVSLPRQAEVQEKEGDEEAEEKDPEGPAEEVVEEEGEEAGGMGAALQVGGPEAAAEGLSTKVASRLERSNLKTATRIQAWWVSPAQGLVEGDIYRTDDRVLFVAAEAESGEKDALVVELSSVVSVYHRRYLLQPNSIEFFVESDAVCAASYFFKFVDKTARDYFINSLIKPKTRGGLNVNSYITRGPSLTVRTPADSVRKYRITEKWVKNQISNFEYLMELNLLAGRSFNDPNQYPVFPWVLCDYTSDQIDLSDPAVYRDLSKPIGALNPARLEGFVKRYKDMQEAGESDLFLYGSHYSYGGAVLFYLARLEPYATMLLKLQDGKWDHPDRMFFSIPATWRAVMEGPTDVKELIPEFYCTPEFLVNRQRLKFGRLQSGAEVDDVVLPPWASSAHQFIHIHRQALESQHVSSSLHRWIDLVFGCKQRGDAAVQANNLFYYLTYEGAVDWAKVDPVEREGLQSHIQSFGQTPSQLFPSKPHPVRQLANHDGHGESLLQQQLGMVDLQQSARDAATLENSINDDPSEWMVVETSPTPGASNKVLAVSRVELGTTAAGGRPAVLSTLVLLQQAEDERLTPLGSACGTGGGGSSLYVSGSASDSPGDLTASPGLVFCVTSSLNFYNVRLDFQSLKLTNKEAFSLANAAGTVGGLVQQGPSTAPQAPPSNSGLSQTLASLNSWSPWNYTARSISAGDSAFEMSDDRFHPSHRMAQSRGGKVYIAGAWDGKVRVVHTKRPTVVIEAFSLRERLAVAQRAHSDAVDGRDAPDGGTIAGDDFEPGMATCIACSEPILAVGTSLGLVVILSLSDKGEKRVTAATPRSSGVTRVIRGHAGFITSIAVQQKLDTVVSGSSHGDILIHSLRSGVLVRALQPPEGTTSIRRLVVLHCPPHTAYPLVGALCDVEPRRALGGASLPFQHLDADNVIHGLEGGDGLSQSAVVFTLNGEVLLSHEALGEEGAEDRLKVRDIALLAHPVPLLCLVGGEEDASQGGFARFLEVFRGGVVVPAAEQHLHLPAGETFASCTPLPEQSGDGAVVLGALSGSLFVLCVDRGIKPESQWPFKIQSTMSAAHGTSEGWRALTGLRR